jgi:hypothetical protein
MPGPARGAGVGRSEPFRFGENEVTIDVLGRAGQ